MPMRLPQRRWERLCRTVGGKEVIKGAPCRNARSGCAVLFAVAVTFIAVHEIRGQSGREDSSVNTNLTYSRGQSILPHYEGWVQNPDGSFDMSFGYLNQNWQEELDIPIGPDNNIEPEPFGRDAGQ